MGRLREFSVDQQTKLPMHFTKWCRLACSHILCFKCCLDFLVGVKSNDAHGCPTQVFLFYIIYVQLSICQGCGHVFKRKQSLGNDDGLYVSVVRKYLSNINPPTTALCDQQRLTDLIKSHKDKENQSQEKLKQLTEQRSENDTIIQNLEMLKNKVEV